MTEENSSVVSDTKTSANIPKPDSKAVENGHVIPEEKSNIKIPETELNMTGDGVVPTDVKCDAKCKIPTESKVKEKGPMAPEESLSTGEVNSNAKIPQTEENINVTKKSLAAPEVKSSTKSPETNSKIISKKAQPKQKVTRNKNERRKGVQRSRGRKKKATKGRVDRTPLPSFDDDDDVFEPSKTGKHLNLLRTLSFKQNF